MCCQEVYFEQLGTIVDEVLNGPSQSSVKVAEAVDDVMEVHRNGVGDSGSCDDGAERNGKTSDNTDVSLFGTVC